MNLFKLCHPLSGKIIFFSLLFIAGYNLHSQSVGIGDAGLNENAVLNISSGSKGLLIPRLTSTERVAIASPANGLMVYDKDRHSFYYYNSRQGWVEMKPTPAGTIVMWYGSITGNFSNGVGINKMKGWALCDGSGGRPDLRSRFVVGYSGSGDYVSIGNTGGSSIHQLADTEMPSHTHSISDPGHSHSAGFGSTNHSHTFIYRAANVDPDYAAADDGSSITYDGGGTNTVEGTTMDGVFSATISEGSAGLSVNNAGSGVAHYNMPPYYVLAYIIKI